MNAIVIYNNFKHCRQKFTYFDVSTIIILNNSAKSLIFWPFQKF